MGGSHQRYYTFRTRSEENGEFVANDYFLIALWTIFIWKETMESVDTLYAMNLYLNHNV